MKKLINLTPHAVNFINELGENFITIQPSGIIPRCQEIKNIDGDVNGITINKKSFGAVVDLPAPQQDTLYIVSVLVANAAPDRNDLLVPDDVVRNERGQIVGCKSLARV